MSVQKCHPEFNSGSIQLIMTLIVSFFTISFLLVPPAFAQTATPSAYPIATTSASTVPPSTFQLPTTISPTSPLYTDLLVHNLFHTASCLMAGFSIIGQPCLTYKVTQDAQGAIKSVPILSQANLSGGALGTTASIIDLLYLNRPIKTSDYLATLGEDLGIKEAHAQVFGSGANILNPVIKLWQVSRNVSYLFMILVFIIIGLMVMFRQRLNQQTVVTAQLAIPGLIIGLILITFSYFLAALLSDMAFIGTNLVGYYFSAAAGNLEPNLVGKLSDKSVLHIFGKFVGDAADKDLITNAVTILFNAVEGTTAETALKWLAALASFITIGQLGGGLPIIGPIVGLVGSLIGAATAVSNPTAVFGLVLWFIAIAILIYSMLRLLLRLINNFLSIIYLTISAPFHFLAASLPGRQDIGTNWIFNMLCNVLAFPAVAAIFYFVAFLLAPLGKTYPLFPSTGAASITGTIAFPLFGGLNLKFINTVLAFGALVASPAIPDIVCRVIGRLGVEGQLIGQELGGSVAAGRGYHGQFIGYVGGIGGAVGGGVGNLVDQPGWEPVFDTNGRTIIRWKKSQFGGRPGLWSKARGYFSRPAPPATKT